MQDHDRIRALVDAEQTSADGEPEPKSSSSTLRYLRYGLAALIVVASVGMAGWLVLSELTSDDEESVNTTGQTQTDPTAVPNTGPTVPASSEPAPESASTDSANPFAELRYLPAGSIPNLELMSILRTAEAEPWMAFTRSDRNGRVSAIILVDQVADELIAGVGVPEPAPVTVGGQAGVLASIGPQLSHVISWDDDELGPLRAWGIGLSAIDQAAVVDEMAGRINGSDADAELPPRWQQVANYEANESGPVWRAYYLGDAGEVAVITTSASPTMVDRDSCQANEAQQTTCETADAEIDADGVEVALLGGQSTIEGLRDRLRPASLSNARVRSLEVEPFASVDVVEAADMLYLPDSGDGWSVSDTLAYSSTQVVSEPALVLFERDTPQIGAIVSAVVVQIVPDVVGGSTDTIQVSITPGPASDDASSDDSDASEGGDDEATGDTEPVADGSSEASDAESPDDETIDDEDLVIGETLRLTTTKSGVDYEVLGWNHGALELALVETLLTADETGLGFAARAGESVGLERQYESVVNPVPRVMVEGTVFSARLVTDDGQESTIRVSNVPSFVPEASVIHAHENERVLVNVRGTTAALLVSGERVTLQWEEEPGLLISLTGSDADELRRLARSLEVVPAETINN